MATPPDPILVSTATDWLVRSREDLETAALILAAPAPLVRSALFHCQQAVEKAMKAFLAWSDAPFRKTHNLVELGDACAAVDTLLSPATERVIPLAKYASRFRYPGAPYEPDSGEAEEALHLARTFLAAMAIRFPPEIVSAAGLASFLPPPP